MLRIEIEKAGSGAVTLSLAGDFCAGDVAEVGRLLDEAARSGERVAIDLSSVRRVDRDAVRFLLAGGARGADLLGCPAYVREWMRCEARRRISPERPAMQPPRSS
jgi:anti-anti-sigma regulatory factor